MGTAGQRAAARGWTPRASACRRIDPAWPSHPAPKPLSDPAARTAGMRASMARVKWLIHQSAGGAYKSSTGLTSPALGGDGLTISPAARRQAPESRPPPGLQGRPRQSAAPDRQRPRADRDPDQLHRSLAGPAIGRFDPCLFRGATPILPRRQGSRDRGLGSAAFSYGRYPRAMPMARPTPSARGATRPERPAGTVPVSLRRAPYFSASRRLRQPGMAGREENLS
jgi:hypothetical protein